MSENEHIHKILFILRQQKDVLRNKLKLVFFIFSFLFTQKMAVFCRLYVCVYYSCTAAEEARQ